MLPSTSTPLQPRGSVHRAALWIQAKPKQERFQAGARKERQGSPMARVIQFYIPENYHLKPKPLIVSLTRGKLIEFPARPTRQSA
jgi:hypothetical protein